MEFFATPFFGRVGGVVVIVVQFLELLFAFVLDPTELSLLTSLKLANGLITLSFLSFIGGLLAGGFGQGLAFIIVFDGIQACAFFVLRVANVLLGLIDTICKISF